MGEATTYSCRKVKLHAPPTCDFTPSGQIAKKGLLLTVIFIVSSLMLQAQSPYCNGNVPTFVVNMTGNPNGTWISPIVSRNDQCCGVQPPDQCVQFIVTLDPNSTGIIFNIYSGAVPPGALFYQINCSSPTPVGQPICLTGVGPHYITFCKPGNNNNQYSITALAVPTASPDITINDGCSGMIYASNFDDTTITWTSIYPGPAGTYDSFLSCTQDCDTVIVTGSGNMPPYVDYQVCGASMGGCGQTPTCDTVRVYFNPTLAVQIVPAQPTVCFGNTGTWITANGSGGSPPYSYLWSNGDTTASVYAGPGTYTVTLADTSHCPPTTATVTVTSFTATITANAGPDINICNTAVPVQLNGSVTGVTTGQWLGGSGSFNPSNTNLQASYSPSPAEIAAGQVTLQLITTNTGTCPPDTDDVVIYMHSFTGTIAVTETDVLCYGQSNGSASATINGGNSSYSYSWNTSPVQTGSTANALSAGSYSVTATDAFGCVSSSSFTITEPPVLTLSAAGVPATCNGTCNGQLVAVPGGGVQPYNLLWSSGCTNLSCSGVCAGTYSVSITDANGCTTSNSATVTEPPAMTAATSSVNAHCNTATGSLSVNVSGGSPGYQYQWNPGNITTATANNMLPGSYVLTITDQQNCSLQVNAQVINQPGVVAAVTNIVQPLCANACTGAASASSSGGSSPYTYAWSNNSSASNVNSLCDGQYQLIITDADGCSDTASFQIQSPLPVTVNANAPPVICPGQSVLLTASASGGTPGYSFTWSSGSPNVSPAATTSYTVTAADTNGCASGPATVIVTVYPGLSVVASGGGSSCLGSPVQLSAAAAGGNGGPYTYTWLPGNLSGNSITVSPTSSTTYTVSATDNCSSPAATATVAVTVLGLPVISFLSDDTSGCENICVQFTNTSPGSVTQFWDFGDGGTSTLSTPSHCYPDAGNYNVSLTVTDNNGCTNTANYPSFIIVHANPEANFSLGPQPTTILNPQICFSDLSTPDVTQWYWNFGDPNDQTTSYIQAPCHSYSDTGYFCTDLVVHNNYGCMDAIQYCLRIDPYFSIYVPNAFTPNDDGINDYFLPIMLNVLEDNYELVIYDRWGNLIFETHDIHQSWDGRAANGNQVAQIDTYVWKIQVKDYTGARHRLIGHVSIIR